MYYEVTKSFFFSDRITSRGWVSAKGEQFEILQYEGDWARCFSPDSRVCNYNGEYVWGIPLEFIEKHCKVINREPIWEL